MPRIFDEETILVTTGGGGGGAALIRWGPDFGTLGGDSLPQMQSLAFTELGVGADVGQVHSLVNTALEVATGTAQIQALLNPEIGIGADIGQVHALVNTALGVGADIGQVQALLNPALGVGADIGQVQALGGKARGEPFWQAKTQAVHSAQSTSITVSGISGLGLQVGDLMLAFVASSLPVAGTHDICLAPAGWGRVSFVGTVGTAVWIQANVFARYADGTETDTQTFVSDNAQDQMTAEIHRITGVGKLVVSTVASPWSGFGNALTFDGVSAGALSQRIVGPAISSAGIGAFTIEARHRRTRQGITEGIVSWFAYGPDNGVSIYFDFPDKVFCVVYSAGVGIISLSSAAAIPNGDYVWRAVWDGTNLHLYQDGTRIATGALASFPSGSYGFNAAQIAYDFRGVGPPYPAAGVVDEVRLSNVARSTGASYVVDTAPFTTDANTMVLWHCDSITTGVTPDASGNGRDGTLIGHPIGGTKGAALLATALTPDPISPSVITTVTNCLVFAFLAHYHAALTNTHTAPAGHIERTDYESTVLALILSSTVDTRTFAAAGATGTAVHDCTETVSTDAAMTRIAIAPGDVVF